jgi:hypothetical protein
VIHELSRDTDMQPAQAAAFIGDFIKNIGGLDLDAQRFTNFVDTGGNGWMDPFPPPDPVLSIYDDAINSLAEESRAAAREFAAAHHVAGLEDRIRATIVESANTDRLVESGQMSLEDARAHLQRIATLGVPADQAESIKAWFTTLPPEADTAAPPASPPEPAPPPQSAPALPAGPTRADIEARIAAHERNMRAEPGSEPWRDYWTRGGSADCLAARQALEAAETPAPIAD